MYSMTHINIHTSTNDEKGDWLRVLNWKPKIADDTFEGLLPNIGGPGMSLAKFTPQDAGKLRRFVDAWLAVGRDWAKLKLPELDVEQITKHLQAARAYISKGEWKTGQNGRLTFEAQQWLDDSHARPFDLAASYFIRIAADSEGWRLCAPCSNCGKYFLRQRRRREEKKYCGGCRRRESKHRMSTLREKQHAEYLGLAKLGIQDWKKRQRREDWATWVARYIRERIERLEKVRKNSLHLSIITSKALTRWANSGELKAPAVKKKSQKGEN